MSITKKPEKKYILKAAPTKKKRSPKPDSKFSVASPMEKIEKLDSSPLSVIIENVQPAIDNGRFPIKRIVGDTVAVTADIFKEGHDSLKAFLYFKDKKSKTWTNLEMKFLENDRWQAEFKVTENTTYQYTLKAFPTLAPKRVTEHGKIFEIIVDIPLARFASWYEMWPRSQGTIPNKSATFKDMQNRLPEIVAMGFNVVYLTPIHPIGRTKRKGPNNSVNCGPADPGCPYAVGNELGGHKAIEPCLGSFKDFDLFIKKANTLGIEIALDIAHTCSPDHPYVKEYPDWFYHNSDGTIECAKNPPKIYEDIYPLNFYCKNWRELWNEMLDIFLFWIKRGVKIFRVDNPHTKPFDFWEWIINQVRQLHPDVIFLSEAFTRPKIMKLLAKLGFTQSYSYFTWRNSKRELTEYLSELSTLPVSDYMRGNLFTNTPDILPFILQQGGRTAFKIRITLAATLSPLYGIYNGFELCENQAVPGKEEYINSEKYQFKIWDWNRPGHIKKYISRLNQIRKENTALHDYNNLQFWRADSDQILFYSKISPDKKNVLLIVVNVDPYHTHDSFIYVPLAELSLTESESYRVRDLITNKVYFWRGSQNYIKLSPDQEMAHLFRLEK